MSDLTDRITEVLRKHREEIHEEDVCICGWQWTIGTDWPAHVAERIAEALQPELGELEATKLLLAATQEQLARTVADFCAVRDALPRQQVEQILRAQA